MNRAIVVLMSLVVGVLPVQAGGILTKGLSVIFSVGSDKDPWASSLVFIGSLSGHLTPMDGIITVQPGEVITGQINFAGAPNAKAYRFFWQTQATPGRSNSRWNESSFSEDYGWLFQINPEDYEAACNPNGLMVPLQMRVVKKNGKDKFIRVIFKITYDQDNVRQHDLLYIRVAKPAPSAPVVPIEDSAPCKETEDAINETRDALVAVSEQLAAHTATDVATHLDLVEDGQRQDRNIEEVARAVDKALALANSNGNRLEAVESYLEALSAESGAESEPAVAVADAVAPFTTQWVVNGEKFQDKIYLRCRVNGKVVTGKISRGFATWDSVPDGARLSFEWRISSQDNWIRHNLIAFCGQVETITINPKD